MELRYIGGIYGGNIKVTPFLCLILKLLQIQPDKDIVVEFISQQDCKWVSQFSAGAPPGIFERGVMTYISTFFKIYVLLLLRERIMLCAKKPEVQSNFTRL